ncbi:hypothetical protein LshimejAT787_1700170 [Lyophyllum shimeji]|uniref:Uncharacterized protein n=1 Tax=Lyophyllum shimeji TaxID=47721 RepID=A0A9P3PYK5_LYOSH|nr:hypothetical protein LshimejAT787_1700170 [Lyophyllum shimeji]
MKGQHTQGGRLKPSVSAGNGYLSSSSLAFSSTCSGSASHHSFVAEHEPRDDGQHSLHAQKAKEKILVEYPKEPGDEEKAALGSPSKVNSPALGRQLKGLENICQGASGC